MLSQQGRLWQSADRLMIKTCLTNSNGITTISMNRNAECISYVNMSKSNFVNTLFSPFDDAKVHKLIIWANLSE